MTGFDTRQHSGSQTEPGDAHSGCHRFVQCDAVGVLALPLSSRGFSCSAAATPRGRGAHSDSEGSEMTTQLVAQQTRRVPRVRTLRAFIISAIVILSVQAWFGDTINIFIAPSHGIARPAATLGGFVSEVGRLRRPFFLEWHTWEGVVLLLLAVTITALASVRSRSAHIARGSRWWSVVGLLSVVSAGYGGYQFVMSGFANGPSSAQMGGSFIAAYASYFMALYYTK
jgi:hypothetical protein